MLKPKNYNLEDPRILHQLGLNVYLCIWLQLILIVYSLKKKKKKILIVYFFFFFFFLDKKYSHFIKQQNSIQHLAKPKMQRKVDTLPSKFQKSQYSSQKQLKYELVYFLVASRGMSGKYGTQEILNKNLGPRQRQRLGRLWGSPQHDKPAWNLTRK